MGKKRVVLIHLLMCVAAVFMGFLTFRGLIWFLGLHRFDLYRATVGGVLLAICGLIFFLLVALLLIDLHYNIKRGVYSD